MQHKSKLKINNWIICTATYCPIYWTKFTQNYQFYQFTELIGKNINKENLNVVYLCYDILRNVKILQHDIIK